METVVATTPVFRDFAEADHTLGLGRNMQQAINAGYVAQGKGGGGSPTLLKAPSARRSPSSL
ncbi:hypothetical protein AB0H92_05435 [Streptomyces phaeochromogenes]|uniref:hypothetical protein n=1 Tax=Streptomyces phaeochromogenes TaxID=1923 RepID=UPI0033E11D03